MRNSAVLLGLVSSLCAGCVDPKGDFNDFAARVGQGHPGGAKGDASTEGGSCTVSPASVQGDYLFALSVAIAPTTPIVLKTTLTTSAFNGGTGLSFDAQPLAASDRTTPVGDPLSLGPFVVDVSGHFVATLPDLNVDAAANPITAGDITADLTLNGNLCGDGAFFCGTASGRATAPIDVSLDGSTFTLTKLTSFAVPTQPKIDCAGNPSDPPKG